LNKLDTSKLKSMGRCEGKQISRGRRTLNNIANPKLEGRLYSGGLIYDSRSENAREIY